jgi:hypothetical protein
MKSLITIQGIKRGFAALILFINVSQLHAQQVIVNLVLQPPYSSSLIEYSNLENRAIITLTNTTANIKEVRLIGSITNESQGLFIRTAEDYQPSLPIILQPNSTKILRANPHGINFLDQGNIRTNATDAQQQEIIRTGLLPEGYYRVCLDVYEYSNQVLLSPQGSGCFGFDISQADPPIITYPLNAEVLPVMNRNPVFTWTPPLGSLAGAQIKYDQIVVKLMPGQNPNDAIAAARDFNANNPVIFNRNLTVQTYVRQPFDLPFEPGESYAMQVIAKDINNNLQIRNLGRSEIIVFSYGRQQTANSTGLTLDNNVSDLLTSINLTGNLRYFYNVANAPSENSGGIQMNDNVLNIINNSSVGNSSNNNGYYNNTAGNSPPPLENNSGSGNSGKTGSSSGNGIQQINNQATLNGMSNSSQITNGTGSINTDGLQQTGQTTGTGNARGGNNNQYIIDNRTNQVQSASETNGFNMQLDDGFIRVGTAQYEQLENSPLGGVSVKLVLGWQLENPTQYGLDNFVNPGNTVPAHIQMHVNSAPQKCTKTLAVAFTASNGNFGFSVPELDEIEFGWQEGLLVGDVDPDFQLAPGSSMTQAYGMISYSGRFKRVLQVMIESNYHCDPVQYSVDIPENGNLGKFYAQVRTINAFAFIMEKQVFTPVGSQEVMLLRKLGDRPSKVPKDEGTPGNFDAKSTITKGGVTYEIIQKQVTPADGFYKGQVVFSNVVQWDCASSKDRYFIYTRIADAQQTNQSFVDITPVEYRYFHHDDWSYASQTNTWNPSNINHCEEDALKGIRYGTANSSSAQFAFHTTDFFNMVQLQRAKPRLYTTVRNTQASVSATENNRAEGNVSWKIWKISKAGMQDLKGEFGLDWGTTITNSGAVGVSLINASHPGVMTLEYSGITANDGRIDRDNLGSQWSGDAQIGYYRFLTVEKSGFKGQAVRAIAQTANNTSGDVGYIPFGTAHKINDIELMPRGVVYVKLHNELDQAITAQAIYYVDPAINQQGISSATNSGGGALVYCPTGSVKIVVIPSDSDKYQTDTVTINVPAVNNIQNIPTVDVLIKFRIHRIHFIVKDANNQNIRIANATVKLMNSNAVFYDDLKSPWTDAEAAMLPPIDVSQINMGNDNSYQNVNGNNVQENQNQFGQWQVYNPNVKKTNNGGGVDFAFRNSSDDFEFRFYSPDGKEYVTKVRQVHNNAGTSWKQIVVKLTIGRIIRGTVKLSQSPVANATVSDLEGNYQAQTNDSGYYEIHCVPKTEMFFAAFKQPYIGAEYDEAANSANGMYIDVSGNSIEVFNETPALNNNSGVIGSGNPLGLDAQLDINAVVKKTINFKLTTYDRLDLTKLLGFPLGVTKLTEGNPVKIKGFVTISDEANSVFKITEETMEEGEVNRLLNFGQIQVNADNQLNQYGVAYARPVAASTPVNKNRMNVKMYNYQATLIDSINGLTLNKFQNTKGSLNGFVKISQNSFLDNSFDLTDNQDIYLEDHGAGNVSMKFPAIGSDGNSPYTNSSDFGVVNQAGNALQYKIFGFDASAQKAGSYISRDSLVLNTRIHANIANISPSDLNILIGKIALVNGEFADGTFNSSFTINLDQFKLKATQVALSQGGFSFNGVLETPGMNLDYLNAQLTPTSFAIPDNSMQAENANLLGVIPVEIKTGISFGYDVNYQGGNWVLAIDGGNPSATISTANFSGFPADKKIDLASLYFYSNGGQNVNLFNAGNYNYRYENIADFTLSSLLITNNSIKVVGNLDLGIPNFLTFTTARTFTPQNGTLTGSTLESFPVNPVAVNGIIMRFANSNSSSLTFSPGNLVIRGNVSDEDPNLFQNINFTLTKTNQDTRLVINELEQQKMRLGGTSGNGRMEATNLSGEMAVANNNWNYLFIDGDLPRDKGFSEGKRRMRFDIRGGLEVNNQGVAIDNIETPFGNITMRYDAAYQRLSGNLEFASEIKNGPSLSGHVAMVMDNLGYYFVCGGTMASSNPSAEGSAFILIGDYTQKTDEMAEILKQHSHYYDALGKLPAGYTNADDIRGFFIEGSANIPVPLIPNFDINLIVVSAALHINVGGDVRFGMNFSDVNMYNVGMGVFVDAEFGVGASAIVACVGVDLRVLVGLDFDGTYYSSNDFEIVASGYITLQGSAYYGAGLYCDAECDGLCVSDGASGSVGLIVQGRITNLEPDYEIIFDASGNTFSENN